MSKRKEPYTLVIRYRDNDQIAVHWVEARGYYNASNALYAEIGAQGGGWEVLCIFYGHHLDYSAAAVW